MDGDYRVTAIYRRQWADITSPYVTPGISADFTTSKNINLGVNVMNQQAGEGGYNYLTANLSMAYSGVRFGVDGNQRISMGMSLGIINRRFDQSKFTTSNQFDPSTGEFNPNIQPDEGMSKTSGTSFDAGAGIMYYDASPGKKMNLFAGLSAFHLTRPEDSFITDGVTERMPVRYTAHGGAMFTISEVLSITPNLLY